MASYTSNTIYNLTALGVGFLLIIAMLGRFSIPFLKGLKKLPVSGEFKLTLDQIIEKWGKDHIRVRDKLLGFGFKIAASLLPLFYRVFQLSGQRHLFSTLTYGVNPFRKITSDSPLGRAAGIEQPMLLGLGWPRWKGKNYEKKSQLINLVGEQKRRVDRLSRIMSYYTLTNQTFDIRVVLTGPLALDSNLDYIDQKLLRNFTWISEELSKHILKSDKIDTTRPIFEWDITVINNDFNQKALSLAQEVKSISWTKKQMRELRKTTTKYLQQGLAWNTKHAEVLMSYYPEPWLANQFFTGLIIDQSIMSSAPLTPLTPRGDFYSGNMGVVAVEPYTLLRSNMPHIHEGGLNIVFHDVIMARQKLQYLVLKKNEKLKKLFEELKDPYEHIEKYLNITKNEPTAGQYILDASKYPGNWGERIYEGTEHEERIDVGWQLWKFATIGLRFFVVAFPLGVLSREVFAPEYSFYSNIVGTLFFAGAGFFIFALPQLWAMQHNAAFVKRSKETKEMIDRIKLVAHNIEQNLYTSSASINGAYRKALDNFKKLYYSSKPFRKGISLDQVEPGIKEFVLQADVEEARLKEFIQSQTIEEKREQIQIISSLLKTRYLPTESNTYGFGLAMLLGLGIWSNIFFVFVSDKSFQNITFSDAVFWYGAMIASAGIFSLLSSKSISNHIKNIRRRAKGIGPVIHSKCSLVFRSLKLKK